MQNIKTGWYVRERDGAGALCWALNEKGEGDQEKGISAPEDSYARLWVGVGLGRWQSRKGQAVSYKDTKNSIPRKMSKTYKNILELY